MNVPRTVIVFTLRSCTIVAQQSVVSSPVVPPPPAVLGASAVSVVPRVASVLLSPSTRQSTAPPCLPGGAVVTWTPMLHTSLLAPSVAPPALPGPGSGGSPWCSTPLASGPGSGLTVAPTPCLNLAMQTTSGQIQINLTKSVAAKTSGHSNTIPIWKTALPCPVEAAVRTSPLLAAGT
jgi:hypothetical protein